MATKSIATQKDYLEIQKTEGASPWMLAALQELESGDRPPRWHVQRGGFRFDLIAAGQSLWVRVGYPEGQTGGLALRAAYSPAGSLEIERLDENGSAVDIDLKSPLGRHHVRLELTEEDRPLLRCTATLVPAAPLFIPYWPRDLIALGDAGDALNSAGVIHAYQIGPRSGQVFFSQTQPKEVTALYFQNLTSLNEYAAQTETSLAEVVGGQWPELGLALPPALKKPLAAGVQVTLSDAMLILSPGVPVDDLDVARLFLQLLAQVFLRLPVSPNHYVDWPGLLEKSLKDLSASPLCWTQVGKKRYLNAYLGDAATPPESMVQMTVLLPLMEYADWSGEKIGMIEDILKGLPLFYDKKAGVLGRWLPSKADDLDGSEPQKNPRVMDSWYLYHSLLNLSRLALRGHKPAQKAFLNSMDFAIRAARKFKYDFPVFYDMDTLEVIKAETEPGAGGEHDTAGLYAHVMMQAWELTKEKRYLEEAKKAAQSLQGLSFRMFYQANSTLFSSGAMLRLWKETGDELYLKLSFLCLANVFNHVWLWDCNYGYGEHYPTYFALFPLRKAPYTAMYEELEGFAAFHDYLAHIEENVPEEIKILVGEFIRHLIYKASFYYPPNLPADILAKKPRTGVIDPKLWIPVEDIYDGLEKPGQVGQEVYGAGMPFGVIPRHYFQVPGERFLVYVNYPTREPDDSQPGRYSFVVRGSRQFECELRIIPVGKAHLPEIEVKTRRDGPEQRLRAKRSPEGHLVYALEGDQDVILTWQPTGQARKDGQYHKNGRTNHTGKANKPDTASS